MLNIQEIENKLWKSAEALRGNMSAEEYMHTVLGILSLKYITDRYNLGLKKLEKDGLSLANLDAETFYYNYKSFVVTEKSSWDHIMLFANSSEIGEKIDEAFVQLEEDNEILKGIFNKNYNREGLDQVKLGEVVKIFSDEDFSEDENEDIIGRIYEYFLGNFFKDRGQKGGEFYTPTSIVELMVSVLKPMKGTIYDPACGTAGILVQSKRYIEDHHGDAMNVTVYGQEYNNVTWKLAKLNLVLNGFPLVDANGEYVLGSSSADTFTNDQHKNMNFDFVMANPPFNYKNWGYDLLKGDSRWKWGVPPSNNANYAWLSHMVSKLNSTGRAAIVLANGSLSSSNKEELEIRKSLIENNKVDAIIELPEKLFYTTTIPACIWFFNNNKKNKNLLMISSNLIKGNMITKKLRELTYDDINKLVALFDKHENGESIYDQGYAKTISKEELSMNDYSFVPGRYVGTSEEIIDKAQIKEEIKNLSKELLVLMKEFSELTPKIEEAIQKSLDFESESKN